MVVYIEAVIIDNFLVTTLAAGLSYRLLGVKVKKLRSVIAAAVGTAVAVFYPFMPFSNFVLVLVKFGLCIVLSLILFYKECNIIKGGGMFLLVTFFFGGALFCIALMIYADVERALKEPLTTIPIGLIIATAFVLYLLLKKSSGHIKKLRDAKKFVADIEVDIFTKTLKCRGFLDTGNRLYDYKSGLPIVVISMKVASQVLDEERLKAILCQKGDTIDKTAHYIDYSTLASKNNKLLVVQPDEIRLYTDKAKFKNTSKLFKRVKSEDRLYSDKSEHRIKSVMIGLAFSSFNDAAEYDAILHPAII